MKLSNYAGLDRDARADQWLRRVRFCMVVEKTYGTVKVRGGGAD